MVPMFDIFENDKVLYILLYFQDKLKFYLEITHQSDGEGNGTPLQYSCLENRMDGGAWWATIHGVTNSRTRLSDFTFTFHFHALEKEMATRSSVLAWRIPGTGSLVDCSIWGRTELDMTEAAQQQQQQHQSEVSFFFLFYFLAE